MGKNGTKTNVDLFSDSSPFALKRKIPVLDVSPDHRYPIANQYAILREQDKYFVVYIDYNSSIIMSNKFDLSKDEYPQYIKIPFHEDITKDAKEYEIPILFLNQNFENFQLLYSEEMKLREEAIQELQRQSLSFRDEKKVERRTYEDVIAFLQLQSEIVHYSRDEILKEMIYIDDTLDPETTSKMDFIIQEMVKSEEISQFSQRILSSYFVKDVKSKRKEFKLDNLAVHYTYETYSATFLEFLGNNSFISEVFSEVGFDIAHILLLKEIFPQKDIIPQISAIKIEIKNKFNQDPRKTKEEIEQIAQIIFAALILKDKKQNHLPNNIKNIHLNADDILYLEELMATN
jgi:hypothetical protein